MVDSGEDCSDVLMQLSAVIGALQSIAKVEPIFSGFRTIQANKEAQRRRLLEITGDGQAVKHELDSLMAIPRKTHADSIGIIRRYRQLEKIVESLKQHDNEKD